VRTHLNVADSTLIAAPRARPSSKLLIFRICRAHVPAETAAVPTCCLVNGARYWSVVEDRRIAGGRVV